MCSVFLPSVIVKPSCGLTDPREQRVNQREETWNTVPMTKSSRTIDPAKIPKISKVRCRGELRSCPSVQPAGRSSVSLENRCCCSPAHRRSDAVVSPKVLVEISSTCVNCRQLKRISVKLMLPKFQLSPLTRLVLKETAAETPQATTKSH